MEKFIEWQKQRAELFKSATEFDKYAEKKKQAGIDELMPYSNFYEIETACSVFNCSQNELFNMDDAFVTKMLLGKKIYSNFEARFNEIIKA